MTAGYFADLPAEDQARISDAIRRYGPLIPGLDPRTAIPDRETVLQILPWQQLQAEILEAHNAWLYRVKLAVERTGREWNRQNFLRYCQLWEHE